MDVELKKRQNETQQDEAQDGAGRAPRRGASLAALSAQDKRYHEESA